MWSGLSVTYPKVGSNGQRAELAWNGTPLVDRAELARRLGAAAASRDAPEIHVRPDAHARYDAFAAVMVAVDQAGLAKVGVTGSEQFIDK